MPDRSTHMPPHALPLVGAAGWTIGRVDLWIASISSHGDEHTLSRCRSILAADEIARAERFRREDDRRRFVLTRGWLRSLLGGYLAQPPERVPLTTRCVCGRPGCTPSRQKPEIAAPDGAQAPLRFNVSHSGDVALLAFSLGREVGVDVERLEDRDWRALAEVALAPRDARYILDLTADRGRRAFFDAWARKEALLKASGHGLVLRSTDLDGLAGESSPPPVRAWGSTWYLTDLPGLPGGYAAALALEGVHPRLEIRPAVNPLTSLAP